MNKIKQKYPLFRSLSIDNVYKADSSAWQTRNNGLIYKWCPVHHDSWHTIITKSNSSSFKINLKKITVNFVWQLGHSYNSSYYWSRFLLKLLKISISTHLVHKTITFLRESSKPKSYSNKRSFLFQFFFF